MSKKNMHAAKVFILAMQSDCSIVAVVVVFLVSFFQIRNLSIEYQTLCDKCFQPPNFFPLIRRVPDSKHQFLFDSLGRQESR